MRLMLPVASITSDVDRDEKVVFYPTFGHLDEEGRTWQLVVRGSIFEPGPDSARRAILVRLLRRLLKVNDGELETEIFRQRIGNFLVTSQRGKQIVIRIGSKTYVLEKRSRRNGHFSGKLRLSGDEVRQLQHTGWLTGDWLRFDVVSQDGDQRSMTGRVQLIGQTGLSVISDIDDTIKHSEVTRRRALLVNTFLREYRPVAGMAEVYRSWAAQGAAFHYVSSSPWQLYDALARLCHEEGFPRGTFHLRAVQLKDPSLLRLFVARRRGKRKVIRSILRAFPRRQFVLVGDSGERDPEIYGALARKIPGQVVRILIRNLWARPVHQARCRKAFRRLPRQMWQLFQDATELEGLLPAATVGRLQ